MKMFSTLIKSQVEILFSWVCGTHMVFQSLRAGSFERTMGTVIRFGPCVGHDMILHVGADVC